MEILGRERSLARLAARTRDAVTIRAVFLDVDDTLVDYQHAATSAFHEVLGDEADYDAFFGLDHYDRYLSGELGYEDARVQRMATFLAMSGRDGEDPAALEAGRLAALEKYYVLYDDALPCIRALRERGLLIGLITNNEAVHQRRKIEAVGLDRLVDTVVISGELGIAKPDARIFAHACAQLDVAPHEAMHVGDAPLCRRPRRPRRRASGRLARPHRRQRARPARVPRHHRPRRRYRID